MEEIERAAQRVLDAVPEYVWDGMHLPVPVADIADTHFGLLIREMADLTAAPGVPPLDQGQTLSGLLLAQDREIWVNAAEARRWPGRRRFTIAHELGHFCLHHHAGGTVWCRHAAVTYEEPRPALPTEEQEANAFAAALLMPAHLVQAAYELEKDFDTLCRLFGASGAAMGRRLHAVVPRQKR